MKNGRNNCKSFCLDLLNGLIWSRGSRHALRKVVHLWVFNDFIDERREGRGAVFSSCIVDIFLFFIFYFGDEIKYFRTKI